MKTMIAEGYSKEEIINNNVISVCISSNSEVEIPKSFNEIIIELLTQIEINTRK
jgi:hypothetical protein